MFTQAEAMVDFMLNYNWTYISLLFNEGPYGENGGKQVGILFNAVMDFYFSVCTCCIFTVSNILSICKR